MDQPSYNHDAPARDHLDDNRPVVVTNSYYAEAAGSDTVEYYYRSSGHWTFDSYHNFVRRFGHGYDNDIKQMYNK